MALPRGRKTGVILFRLRNTRTDHVIQRLSRVISDCTGTHLRSAGDRGAGGEGHGVGRGAGIENMVNCTKVYALAALDICNQRREQVAKS